MLLQIDCDLYRQKTLSYFFYFDNMGIGKNENLNDEDAKWVFATPGSVNEAIIKKTCTRSF